MSLRQTQWQNPAARARWGVAEKGVRVTPDPCAEKPDTQVEDLDCTYLLSGERKRELRMLARRHFPEWS